MERVTLAEAIRELRGQLAWSADESKDAAIRFVPKSIEVELGIIFEIEAETSGGLKLFSLIDLSGKAKVGNENTHKVKLTLEPVTREGKPVLVRDIEG